MIIYFRGYKQRNRRLLAAIFSLFGSLLLCFVLFRDKLNNLSGQILTYEFADYQNQYILNYGIGIENECIFPDTDIHIFLDEDRSKKLTVSVVMKDEDVSYDLDCLAFLNNLKSNEICITKNVAEAYSLNIGDTLFADTSYSSDLISLIITELLGTEFDYTHPKIENGIGIVYIGYDRNYAIHSRSKYLLYSQQSKSDELAKYPQIINDVINKSVNESYVLEQGIPVLIIEGILVLISISVAHLFFFSKSRKLLLRCYLKGMKRNCMWGIPFIEKIMICLPLIVIGQIIFTSRLPDSYFAKYYQMIPVIACVMYTFIFLLIDLVHIQGKAN